MTDLLINIYGDESCHLEKDRQPIMAVGAIWCPASEVKRLGSEIVEIKRRHNACGELKWRKVSQSRLDFYLSIVDWFFAEKEVHFRCVVVRHKAKLNHEAFNQGSHETFYYKLLFSLLSVILDPVNKYNIYLDVKDTHSKERIETLRDVLCNNVHDFTREMINHMQNIPSEKSDLMQLADFLMGAVTYRERNLRSNKAKFAVVKRIEKFTPFPIKYSTSKAELKFNLFFLEPQ